MGAAARAPKQPFAWPRHLDHSKQWHTNSGVRQVDFKIPTAGISGEASGEERLDSLRRYPDRIAEGLRKHLN